MFKELYGKDEALDIKGLKTFSKQISDSIQTGDVIALCGDLGVGKTTLSGFIINNMLKTKQVITSPTFNLVQTYETQNKNVIWHFDLYRLRSPEEVYNLGIEESLYNGISIIEWPEMILNLLPSNTLLIEMKFHDNPFMRVITTASL